MTVRLVGAAAGDPYDPQTSSGASRYLLDALARRFRMVDRVDYALRGWERYIALAASLRWPIERWRSQYHHSRLAISLTSRKLRSRLQRVPEAYDLVVQVKGWVEPHGLPYVMYVDTTWQTVREHWPPWVPSGRRALALLELERRMFQAASHVFTKSNHVVGSLIDFYEVPADRVTVVGGGVNFDRLPEVDRAAREQTILFVGRDYRRKGGDVLVEAFRLVRQRLPNARLVLVGPSMSFSEPGIESLGNVVDRDTLAGLYRRAGVFCLPTRYDAHPHVLPEAMSHALPCVGTRVGGIPEIIVDGETGVLVPPDDSSALADALVRILEQPDYAASLGAAGRRRVETELNWDKVVERMAPAIHEAAERVTSPTPPREAP
jgi:glycosyltransferase involved in cell wall biosynthesis